MSESFIRDNHSQGTVGDYLKQTIHENSDVSIVSAYFTIYAYHHLKNNLDAIHKLRFLFGEPTFIKAIDPEKIHAREFKIEDDKLSIPLNSRLTQRAIAKECAEWIKAKTEIRSMVKPNFLHGKMYHIRQQSGVEDAIAGSSNFTVSGLGLSRNKNIELNLIIDSKSAIRELKTWFDAIWNDQTGLVEDVKDQVLKYLEQLYIENSPEFIYYKTLFHVFEKSVNAQKMSALEYEIQLVKGSKFWKETLFEFQKHGAMWAIQKLLDYNGCILADSVGLGKTYEALAVIKYFEERNCRVLVLCPKKLMQNWTLYVDNQNNSLNPFPELRFNYTVLAHTDLSRTGKAGSIDLETFNWGNFDLVVIDESHNFRNNTKGKRDEDGNIIRKSRYERLMEDIIQSGRKTKVLLLSATPVNTSLRDLRNQIYFITGNKDDVFADPKSLNIPHLGNLLASAQREFTEWTKTRREKTNTTDLFERLGSDFTTLLDGLTIARARKHIQKHYAHEIERLGGFPKRLKPISIYPAIDLNNRFISYDTLNDKIMDYKLSLFNPSAFLKEEYLPLYEEKARIKNIRQFTQAKREHYLIGMMKVNFLKRLESSIHSFEVTMDRTIDKIESLIDRIERFQKFQAEKPELDFDDLAPADAEDEDLQEAQEVGKKFTYQMAHLKLDEWLQALKKDKDALSMLHTQAKDITPDRDAKLKELKVRIEQKINSPTTTKTGQANKKVLIFTAFADTAGYLYNSLADWAKNLGIHTALVSGGSGGNKTTLGGSRFEEILTNFSPRAKNRAQLPDLPQNEEVDLLIATDCISEGQNLQDCDWVINYDIHWNPVRVIQRFGRIDRIGTVNEAVQLINFWPTPDLNKYINLKNRVEARMALVDLAATGADNLLQLNEQTPEELENQIQGELNFRDQQLLRLQNEIVDLEDLGESINFSDFTLDDFRTDLINFIETNKKRLNDAPFGLYAVVPAPAGNHAGLAGDEYSSNVRQNIKPGAIFCLRQKEGADDLQKVNPLQPYYLVYIQEDGRVRWNYAQARQILELFRLLCQGKKQAYETLCDIFNAETQNGEKMDTCNRLLSGAIEAINQLFKKKNFGNLAHDRNAVLISVAQAPTTHEQFELITWLILK